MDSGAFERVVVDTDLTEGSLLGAELSSGARVCLARVNGEVFAVSDICSHAEFSMSEGDVDSDYIIECALHGARYDLRTGDVVGPPAESGLPTYEVKVEDGGIWVGARKS